MATRWTDPEWGAARIAGVYLGVSAAWILGSDALVQGLVESPARAAAVQTVKGTAFVGGTTLLLFALVRREQRKLASTNDDLERTLQHANVLHRLLRHNLRNSCDVILNSVGLLRSGRGDPAANRTRIRRQAARLSAIAAKSQQLRDVVYDDGLEPVALDLVAVVEEAVAGARSGHDDATVDLVAPERLPVVAHPRLAVAVEELVANAVAHQDGDDPTVRVAVEREDGAGVVAVSDDGPGIPAVERDVLTDGVEHTLAHSRGVGLWLVRFVVAESGGTVDVDASDHGTTVRLRFPAAS